MKTLFKRIADYSGLAALAALLFLALLVSAEAAMAAPGLEHVTLQLKWRHQFQFAGYYAAQEKGYYRAAGLEVGFVEAEPTTDLVDEVTSGRAQYGVGNSSLLLERQKGKPVVVLAAVFQHSPLALVVPARSGIDSIHDLVGKRVMLEPHSEELIAYLRNEGVRESSLKMRPHNFDLDDLVNGKIDAASVFTTDEPYLLSQQRFKYLLFSPRAGGIDFYGDNLFTSRRELEEHPERAKAFRAASMQGWKYAMQHPEEIADLILARYKTSHDRDHLLNEARQMVPLLQPTLIEMGYMYPGRWRHIADTYAELGLLPKNFPLEDFLFDPDAGQARDRHRQQQAIIAALGASVFLGAIALLFVHLNRKLKQEIAARAVTTAELEARLGEIQALHASIEGLAVRDALTGLHNRRHLDENFERELARAKRDGHPLSLAVIDIDSFKRINDTYGHPAGDQALKSLAALLQQCTRATDIVCRYGGDEFLLLMPNMGAEAAQTRIDHWRQAFADMTLQHGALQMRATISVGIATFPDHAHTVDDLMSAADQALYISKRNGRDRVSLYVEPVATQATS